MGLKDPVMEDDEESIEKLGQVWIRVDSWWYNGGRQFDAQVRVFRTEELADNAEPIARASRVTIAPRPVISE